MPDKKLDFSNFEPEIQQGILDFINIWPAPKIHEKVKDDPSITTGSIPDFPDYGIGMTVANRLIEYRRRQGGVFWSLDQLNDVPYFGQDKLNDIAFTLKKLNLKKLSLMAPQISKNNHVDVFVSGPECLKVILDEIKEATKYIHVGMMLFFNDISGNKVADALIDRAKDGVEIRVMADSDVTASGYYASAVNTSGEADFSEIAQKLEAEGIKVVDTKDESYWEWQWDDKRRELKNNGVPEEFLKIQDLVQDDVQANWNVANHRKFIVFDGIKSILGSLNIGNQYLYDTPLLSLVGNPHGVPENENEWQDGCFRIKGDFSHLLNRLFASQWMVLGGDVFQWENDFYNPPIINDGSDDCALFISFPGDPTNVIQKYFYYLVTLAEDEVIIENPYIIDDSFWDALSSLDKNPAKNITLINPFSENDHPFNKMAVKCNMWKPADLGVKFYDYYEGRRFSHWKIAYDKYTGSVFHGSYNLNTRSALHDFEANILVRSQRIADYVKTLLGYDIAISKKKKKDDFFEYPNLHASCWFEDIVDYYS